MDNLDKLKKEARWEVREWGEVPRDISQGVYEIIDESIEKTAIAERARCTEIALVEAGKFDMGTEGFEVAHNIVSIMNTHEDKECALKMPGHKKCDCISTKQSLIEEVNRIAQQRDGYYETLRNIEKLITLTMLKN